MTGMTLRYPQRAAVLMQHSRSKSQPQFPKLHSGLHERAKSKTVHGTFFTTGRQGILPKSDLVRQKFTGKVNLLQNTNIQFLPLPYAYRISQISVGTGNEWIRVWNGILISISVFAYRVAVKMNFPLPFPLAAVSAVREVFQNREQAVQWKQWKRSGVANCAF
jgi:hypothetical protein